MKNFSDLPGIETISEHRLNYDKPSINYKLSRHGSFLQRFFDNLLGERAAVAGLGIELQAVGEGSNGEGADVIRLKQGRF